MNPWVAVDLFPGLFPAGGIGRYVRDLCEALLRKPEAPAARFVHPRNFRGLARAAYPPDRLHELPLAWWQLRMLYSAGAVLPLRFDRWFGAPAVVHSTLGYGPRFRRARLICHVHDLTPFEHPEWHPARLSAFLRSTMPHAARSAATVLTHSLHVGRRVAAAFGVAPERIVTIPPPLGHAFHPLPEDQARLRVRDRLGLTEEFVLHVGTLEPRKNHVTLVGAFERLCRAGFPGRLVLVGGDGWKMGPILARIERSPVRERIRRLREIPDEDLVALYGACTACAYPSLDEGFGMPLLESMACGAACVTSDCPALLELGGDGALAVPATDEAALADVLIRLWRDAGERRRLAAPGPERARSYTWDRWAHRIFALYRRELAAAASGPAAGAAAP